jgi:hypothetical protein
LIHEPAAHGTIAYGFCKAKLDLELVNAGPAMQPAAEPVEAQPSDHVQFCM